MSDFHPFFVHFPISLLIVAVFFDFYGAAKGNIESTRTAFILQAIAALAALLAAISGNNAETIILEQADLALGVSEPLGSHVSLGNILVWLIIAAVVGRAFAMLEGKTWAPKVWVFATLSLALAILVFITGLLGGALSHEILSYFVNI